MNTQHKKTLIATIAILSMTVSMVGAVSANNGQENKQEKLSEKALEQFKKSAEIMSENFKKSLEKANDKSSAEPASLTINPNGETKLNDAKVITNSGSSLTTKVWGVTFTLALDAQSQLMARGGSITASQIQVGDSLMVMGKMDPANPLTVQVRQLKDYTIASTNAYNDDIAKVRAQIQALMDKLNALLAKAGGNTTTTTPVPVIVPSINTITPATSTVGSATFTLVVQGTGFASTSVINWAGSALPTSYVSNTQVSATIPAANIASTGTFAITVTTPGIGGGTSNSVSFTSTASSTTP